MPNSTCIGPPEDLESCIQATGCAGRDGSQSIAALMHIKGIRTVSVDAKVKKNIRNSQWFHNYKGWTYDIDSPWLYSDICSETFNCTICDLKVDTFCV